MCRHNISYKPGFASSVSTDAKFISPLFYISEYSKHTGETLFSAVLTSHINLCCPMNIYWDVHLIGKLYLNFKIILPVSSFILFSVSAVQYCKT